MKTRKKLILAKTETTYGTDAVPGGADAILVRSVDLDPMDMDLVDRDLVRPYKGNSESIPAGVRVKLVVEVELAGAGAAGTVPQWGRLLKACGMSETINAGTNVIYTPISDDGDSLTILCNIDGVVHKTVGARGNAEFSLKSKAIPTIKFSFTGLYVPVVDGAPPTPTYVQQKPCIVGGVNTTGFEIHGFTGGVTEELSIDLANDVVHRSPIGGESVRVVDGKPRGSLIMEATPVSVHDWWSAILSATTGPLTVTHGLVDGNKVTLAGPKVQLVSPKYTNSQGVVTMSSSLKFNPDMGNDELVITVH